MSTESMGKEFLTASLFKAGYKVTKIKTHLFASKGDEHLAIAITSRKLSNSSKKESKPVHLLESKIKNLIKIIPKDKNYKICLGYTVFKYTYNNSVCIVLPLDVWENYAVSGTAISKTTDTKGSNKYYFSYKKMEDATERNNNIISNAKIYTSWSAYDIKK